MSFHPWVWVAVTLSWEVQVSEWKFWQCSWAESGKIQPIFFPQGTAKPNGQVIPEPQWPPGGHWLAVSHAALCNFFAILLIRYKTNSFQCEFDHGRIITGFLSGKGLGRVWRGGGGGGGWTPPKALKGFKSPQRAARRHGRRPARILKSPSFFHSCLFFLIQRSSLRPSVPISVSLSSDHIMTELLLLLLLDERLVAMCPRPVTSLLQLPLKTSLTPGGGTFLFLLLLLLHCFFANSPNPRVLSCRLEARATATTAAKAKAKEVRASGQDGQPLVQLPVRLHSAHQLQVGSEAHRLHRGPHGRRRRWEEPPAPGLPGLVAVQHLVRQLLLPGLHGAALLHQGEIKVALLPLFCFLFFTWGRFHWAQCRVQVAWERMRRRNYCLVWTWSPNAN